MVLQAANPPSTAPAPKDAPMAFFALPKPIPPKRIIAEKARNARKAAAAAAATRGTNPLGTAKGGFDLDLDDWSN